MKTAISLDDDLVKEADQTARTLGLSRSRLFSIALEDYLRRRRQEKMVEQLNQTYSDHPDARTTQSMKAKFRSTIQDRW
jgi:metal-responsive CopG/Arc/MetJ family transcriptional regulator